MAPEADPVQAYAAAVADDQMPAGPMVRAACKRHLDDLERGHERGLRFEVELAQRAIDFFPQMLRFSEGEHDGQPFVLQLWQQFIVGSMFGWLGADGHRRFITCYVEAGKGSGKSPLCAGVGLYMLTADREAGAECYFAAVTRDQAGIMYRDSELMAKASPGLRKRLTIGTNNIAYARTNSFLRPLSSEGRSLDGKRVHFAGLDEIHEHRTPQVVDKMSAGTKGRRQPVIFEITNSGHDVQSVCYQHHDYSRRVVEQLTDDDSWFAYVCGIDKGDDWRDEDVWAKANPNLGVSITRKYLEKQVREAQGMPAKQSIVRRLNFCEWVEADSPWLSGPAWNECSTKPDEQVLHSRPCYVGLDLGAKRDLTAFVIAVPDANGDVHLWPHFWAPREGLMDRVQRDRVPYDQWERDGFIELVPGATVNYDFVAARVAEIVSGLDLHLVYFDRWRIDDLKSALDDIAVRLPLEPRGQGFKDMSPMIEASEEVILNGKLRHGGHPILAWNVASCVVQQDPAGNRKLDKSRATGRIDGAVAMAMAIYAAQAPVESASPYSTQRRAGGFIEL